MLGQYCRAGRHHSDDCIRRHRSLIRTDTADAPDDPAIHDAHTAHTGITDAHVTDNAGTGTNDDPAADPGDRYVRPDGFGLTDRLAGRTAPGWPGDQPSGNNEKTDRAYLRLKHDRRHVGQARQRSGRLVCQH